MQNLVVTDWIVIAGYFCAVFFVAFRATWHEHTTDNSASYFLAGRNVGWFLIGSSLFASNIGSEHLVGLAGAGYGSGVAMGQYEIQASLILLLLGWVFVPFYLRSGVFTMPEFLERRYSSSLRWILAAISIIAYVLTKIAITINAGAIVFTTLLGVDFWTGAIIVVVATGIYTFFGGLRAVLYTDMLQMFVLLGGTLAVLYFGMDRLGGWEQMREFAGREHLNMWKPITDPDFPWTGLMIGAPIVGIWYWCTDQFIVQRVLSARDISQARGGTIFAAYLKLLPMFLFVIPGIVAFALFKAGKLPEMQGLKDDQVFPVMVSTLLPVGFRGLVIAGLLAALMSSLSSVFNSCSTLVTWDVYRKLHPTASERQLVWVGQLSTVFLVVLGLFVAAVIEANVYTYLQSVQTYISPPITAVFLIGVFWKRANSWGALAAIVVGFSMGMGRLVLDLYKDSLPEGILLTLATVNFMHVGIFLFLICIAILVGVSLMTQPQPDSQLVGITYGSAEAESDETSRMLAIETIPRWLLATLSVGSVAIVVLVWIYFSKAVQ